MRSTRSKSMLKRNIVISNKSLVEATVLLAFVLVAGTLMFGVAPFAEYSYFVCPISSPLCSSDSTYAIGDIFNVSLDISSLRFDKNILLAASIPSALEYITASPLPLSSGDVLMWTINKTSTTNVILSLRANESGEHKVTFRWVEPVSGEEGETAVNISVFPGSIFGAVGAPSDVRAGYEFDVVLNLAANYITNGILLAITLPDGITFVSSSLPNVLNLSNTLLWTVHPKTQSIILTLKAETAGQYNISFKWGTINPDIEGSASTTVAVSAADVCSDGIQNGNETGIDCGGRCIITNPEICDGIDNNRNCFVDEGLGSTTCGVGACQRTVQSCVNGTAQRCVPGTPGTESVSAGTCNNGIDDDCDGLVDSSDTGCLSMPCPNGLVGYWKLDDGTGSIARDSSGNDKNATLVNGAAWSTGKSGQGVTFDGVDDELVVPSFVSLYTNFTISLWVRANETHQIDPEANNGYAGTSGQKYVIYPAWGGDFNAGVGLSVGTNGISVYEHGNVYMPPLAVYSGNLGTSWHHIAVVYSDKTPKIYLDGELVRIGKKSNKNSVYLELKSTDSGGGRFGGGQWGHFKGSIDEVAVFNRSLNASEISEIYNKGTGLELCGAKSHCVPSTEICDGIDNDCDGDIDEALGSTTCGVGACQRTVQSCVNGTAQRCVPGTPGTESVSAGTCNNGIDDDCDGFTDSTDTDCNALNTSSEDLLLHLEFDDPTNLVLDSSSNKNDIVNYGVVYTYSGKSGGAAYFNGSSYIEVALNESIRNSYTMSAWFNAESLSSGWKGIVTNSAGNHGIFIFRNNIDYYVINSHLSNSTISEGIWYHVAIVFNGSTGKIYVNGVLDTGPIELSPTTIEKIKIGSDLWNEYFHGMIDDVQIYNRALNASEVELMYYTSTTKLL